MQTEFSSINANITVEGALKDNLKELETLLEADVLVFFGPIIHGVDSEIKETLDLRRKKRKKLFVILETEGGYIEVAERIANIFRRKYKSVEFIVPNFAMSAGTVLVMSGDAIHMDYFSVLGPIDPQVESRSGGLIPALGYLDKYKELIEKSKKGELTQAELHFLIEKFDPAMLHKYEQAKELSITLLKTWLVKYKFKNWKITKTRRIQVTKQMRKERAEKIGEQLNKTTEWHTHSRGISMNVLKRSLKLEIEDFELNRALDKLIKKYYKLVNDYMAKRSIVALVHTHDFFKPLFFKG